MVQSMPCKNAKSFLTHTGVGLGAEEGGKKSFTSAEEQGALKCVLFFLINLEDTGWSCSACSRDHKIPRQLQLQNNAHKIMAHVPASQGPENNAKIVIFYLSLL